VRKLMWFAIGFTAACAAGVYLLSGAWYLLIGLFCLIGAFIGGVKDKAAFVRSVILFFNRDQADRYE